MERSNFNSRSRSVSRHKSYTNNKPITISIDQKSTPNSHHSHSNFAKHQCDSHYFELKPLNGNSHIEHTVYQMVHEGDFKPFPIIMTEFMNVGLMPIFGLEREISHLRPKVKKCQQGLQQEVSRITQQQLRGHERSERLFTPMPKHTVCQVCREEFDDYQKHIDGYRHRKNANEALGMEYIRNTIDEINMAVYDQNEQEDLRSLLELKLTLEETIPCVRQHFKQFLTNLATARNS